MERKFKFVGDPSDYNWDNKPSYGLVYPGDFIGKCAKDGFEADPLQEWALERRYDWQEVTEPEMLNPFENTHFGPIESEEHSRHDLFRIPNQDQPASSMTKFEMAVFLIIQGSVSNTHASEATEKTLVEVAISIAKETFKQLDQIK